MARQEASTAQVLERLDALVDWERRRRGAMRVSIDPARALLDELGHPEQGLRVVHVAGSKGKGSVSALVAAGLHRAGLRVGLYTSPHVVRLNERIAVDGEPIDDELLAWAVERALRAREVVVARDRALDPTAFDVLTVAALEIFRARAVEWIVVEVGLGGRLDSTNALYGEVCVITSIEMEHAEVLGPTLEAIAGEKSGILKPGSVLVTGVANASDAGRVIDARARLLGVPVRRPDWLISGASTLIGARNMGLAALALDELGARGVCDAQGARLDATRLDSAAIRSAALPARLERFERDGIEVVLDGAHTPQSFDLVLAEFKAARPPVVVFGLALDKDAGGILESMAGRVDALICTATGSDLHHRAGELERRAREHGLAAQAIEPVGRALEVALDCARRRTAVLVAGSLQLARIARPLLARSRSTPPA